MTNFQPNATQGRFSWLTPERALVVLPMAVGLTFALILGGALVVRFQSEIDQLTTLEKERLQKQDELAFLGIQKRKLKQSYEEALVQTQLLQQLVTGNQSVETLLTQLNLEASASSVALDSYEPQNTQASKPASSTRSRAQTKKDATPEDPLLTDGVIKEKRLIVVKGSFVGLLEFLRRLERITPLLVMSDLSLQADSGRASAQEAESQAMNTLRFTVTAYTKPQAATSQKAEAKPLALP